MKVSSFPRHKEDHVDLGAREFVGGRKLKFIFEIGDRPQATDQMLCSDFPAIINREARIEIHFDVGQALDCLLHHG